ncbi:MAG TPA: hypothetical protein ENI49_01825 [Thermoplasmatales archaeon]|nr:hypothetical protein [Thermoplasmatales archaeon]
MVRKKVIVSYVRDKRCPVCSRNWPTINSLAKHIAMKRDQEHESWKREHNIYPIDYQSNKEVTLIASQIKKILENK